MSRQWDKLGIGHRVDGDKETDTGALCSLSPGDSLTLHCAPRILPCLHHLVAYLQFFCAANDSKWQVGLKHKANESSELQGQSTECPTIQLLLLSGALGPHTAVSLTVIIDRHFLSS